jgi:hypothetical protein
MRPGPNAESAEIKPNFEGKIKDSGALTASDEKDEKQENTQKKKKRKKKTSPDAACSKPMARNSAGPAKTGIVMEMIMIREFGNASVDIGQPKA